MGKKQILFIVVLIGLLCLIGYKTSFTQRTQTKIKNFETKFVKNIDRKQKDLCGSKFKDSTVSDFYICSSHKPFLTGYLQYDYSSLDMLQKAIIYGSRYIELEIFNKDIRNDTIPVIGSSSSDGSVIYGQNTLDCEDVFKLIANVVFSERYLDNFKEPFFIFLNLKLKNNTTSLDKLYDIIKRNLNLRLLDSNYSHQKQNIARTKMCHLMEKIVIFSSEGYEHSKMEEIINMSTKSPNLRRLKYTELPHTKELANRKDVPNVSIISKKIKLTDNIIYMLDDTNLLSLGIEPHMSLQIGGSKHNENNTNDNVVRIKTVTKNAIVLDGHNFIEESGETKLALKIFDSSYSQKNIDRQNKSSLTIVYTEHDFFNFNFDPEHAWNLGCQFVCMNFQKIDYNLKKYMKKFNQFSLLQKPSNLRFVERTTDTKRLNTLFPKYIEANNSDIIYDFSKNNFEVNLIPYKYSENIGCCVNKSPKGNVICSKYSNNSTKCNKRENCEFTNDIDKCKQDIVKIVYNNDFLSVSPSHSKTDSLFEIVPGLDNKFESISIKYNNKYLVTNNSCCYLSFKLYNTNTNLEQEVDTFRKHASFYAVKPICSKEGFVSFMQMKDEKKYYIKYRKEFNYNERVYSSTSNEFKLIGEMVSNEGVVGIYQVKANDNYKSIGHIFVKGNAHKTDVLNKNVLLLKGAVSDPIGFELMWNSNNLYIWKPIPGDGYVALGVAVTLNKTPPDKTLFCCVAIEFTSEVLLENTPFWSSKGNNPNNPVSLWEVPSKNYFISNTAYTKPSEFSQPVYSINLEATDYMDRLFMGKETTTTEPFCFKVIKNKTKIPNKIEELDFNEYTEENNYKISFYKTPETNGITEDVEQEKKCVGLDYVYWSKYYGNDGNDGNDGEAIPEKKQLISTECNSNDYMGTNFVLNNDSTIRLKENTKYCLENTENNLFLNKCNSTKAQEFFYDKSKNSLMSLVNNNCLNDSLTFTETCKSKFIIKQEIIANCIGVNSIVYLKRKVKRHVDSYFSQRDDNTIRLNILNEEIDRTYLHVYVKGLVNEIKDGKYKIKLYDQNSSLVYLDTNTDLVIPYFIPQSNKIERGTELLLENGGIIGKYTEKNIRFMAKVVEKLENNKFVVVFSINSIEADQNKTSLGRPRTNEKKVVDIMDLVLLQPALECN